MATIDYVRQYPLGKHHGPWVGAQWVLGAGDDGQVWEMSGYGDRSVQVGGSFGAGGSVRIEGSNDLIDWVTLTDDQNVALDFSAPGLKLIVPLARYLRPRVTAGTGVAARVTMLEGTR